MNMRQESHKKLYSYIYYCRNCKHLQLEVRVHYTTVSEVSRVVCKWFLLLVSDKSFSWRVLISAHAACWLGGCINPPADQLITQHPCHSILAYQCLHSNCSAQSHACCRIQTAKMAPTQKMPSRT